MKLLTVTFDYGEKDRYRRLTDVWEASARANCPGAELVIMRIDPPASWKTNFGLTSNWHKLKVWVDFIERQKDGEHVVLMDSDMLVLQDLRPAFREEFDIGCTRRTATKWPYNGGVVFVKVNDRSRAFCRRWEETDEAMYQDAGFHDPWKLKYKGQNQASFGFMSEHNDTGAVIREFPCAVWNACNEDWLRFNGDTKVVHIKSQLRRACLGETAGMPSKWTAICTAWRKYAIMVKEAEGAT